MLGLFGFDFGGEIDEGNYLGKWESNFSLESQVRFFKFVFCCLLLERSYCGLISDGIILSLKLILFINGAKSVSPAAKEPKHHAWIAPSA